MARRAISGAHHLSGFSHCHGSHILLPLRHRSPAGLPSIPASRFVFCGCSRYTILTVRFSAYRSRVLADVLPPTRRYLPVCLPFVRQRSAPMQPHTWFCERRCSTFCLALYTLSSWTHGRCRFAGCQHYGSCIPDGSAPLRGANCRYYLVLLPAAFNALGCARYFAWIPTASRRVQHA